MTKVRVIRGKDVRIDREYAPPFIGGEGIHSETVGMPIKMTMQRVVIPPGSRNQRHYHVKTEAGMHILKGRLKMFFGPDHEMEEAIAEAGDFVFVPRGEIHGLINLSNTEAAEIVSSYNSVGTPEEAQTVFVEPVWK
jgi:uncharacterized RmlC-like cupin family protein